MSKLRSINFHTFCALSFFSFGTAMMDYFLVYPSRAIVGEAEFIAYHGLLGAAILPVSVLPFLLITLQNISLVWWRPAPVARWLVLASLACLLLDWASSIFIQIPINLELNNGKDPELIAYIMETNWGRVVLESLQAAFVLAMMIAAGKTGNHN